MQRASDVHKGDERRRVVVETVDQQPPTPWSRGGLGILSDGLLSGDFHSTREYYKIRGTILTLAGILSISTPIPHHLHVRVQNNYSYMLHPNYRYIQPKSPRKK